ncbi:hypothetical protein [Deinococcus yavapaiensis]|uniref:Reverse transcriptase-like protein n=1 Tax=Deinococcus yavapaiensis KR-236 TaxID=694435 RepID=A0A318S1C5_9DEIO|nr:hypothetical protein [Deinococcus yavapaiensis]PYE48101.1 hypothetical protein DES52_1337 [Deinococcus yavapaiensis KR-236]
MRYARHSRLASVHVASLRENAQVVLGYVLAEAPYAVPLERGMVESEHLLERHAVALGYDGVLLEKAHHPTAERIAHVTLALQQIALGASLGATVRETLTRTQPAVCSLLVHADGSFDRADDALGVAYTLNGRPYALTLPASDAANGALAEREALRVALLHARELTPEAVVVRSDHVFHVRRYAENLAHPERRKSPSLERLDALVQEWGTRVRFEYTSTAGTDAPHRLAVHARALRRLALALPLSRGQLSALKRVHYALRSSVPVEY